MSASNQNPGGESNATGADQDTTAKPEPENTTPEPQDANAIAARLRKSERELQKAAKRIEEFEKAAADKAKAEMTDIERHQAENQDLKSKLEAANSRFADSAKRNAMKLALKDAKAKNLDAAMKLADLSGLEIDEHDNVTGADDVVKKMKKEFDFLFGGDPPPSSGGANPTSGPPSITPADYKNLKGTAWADFQKKVMSGEIQI